MLEKKKSEITEENILEAALNLFSEYGYAATSTSKIAKKAGISEATIFKYFPKKKDLLITVITKFIDDYSDILVIAPLEKVYEEHKTKEFSELIKEIIIERVNLFIKLSNPIKILLTEMQYHEELKELLVNKLSIKIGDFGTNMINDFVEKGIIENKNSFIIFRSIMGAVMLMVLQKSIASQMSNTELSFEEEIDIIVDIFLNGIIKKNN